MQHFPSISKAEFHDGCQAFYDTIVSVLDGNSWLQVAYESDVLSIKKEYIIKTPSTLNEKATDIVQHGNEDLIDDEDHEIICRHSSLPETDRILVEFSILWSPSYQVPVLWFTLNRVPSGISTGIETVYQHLVPETSRPALNQVGVMGGISIAHHPKSDLPAFFIHPCNTAEALYEICQQRSCRTALDYLVIWLGLVGPSFNLYIPSQLLLPAPEDEV
ncbi:hypothetical protein GJ744_007781 [Endocarpon pusillum]|uniref:Ubiquitin-like-conjugating enzyme ATG10 n=1 Tax=Endocarpon pusillum TaxID=364733 RepID=A0A8H7E9Q4_9EURO|nr:hypothetical protein GJ744_007781 [Endocarpon pusillum]